MSTLFEMISRSITPEAKDDNSPRVTILSAPIQAKGDKPHVQYEAGVFNFLLANKEALAIKNVIKFTALLLDGAVELLDGKRLTAEVKFRMNWEKACQSEWQFRTFLKRTNLKPFSVDGGIVIFEEFSGDWKRKAGCRLLENGWSHWYRGHSEVDGLRVDLLRLRAGSEKLEGFPIAEALMASANNLSPEEVSRLTGGLEAGGG
jgi:hypothetical protein